ncbi:MAG: flagellar hook-basal body complex protein FliE [Calditrichaeota bacterium]|nr:flagellar hook-basal body complex protein FliE [Calditrichota bacterium]
MVDKIKGTPFQSQLQEKLQRSRSAGEDVSFKDTLKEALQEINELQQDAGETTERFLRGEITDLHQVMIAVEKARVGLELMLEIRNKMVEAYKEIMRMQM